MIVHSSLFVWREITEIVECSYIDTFLAVMVSRPDNHAIAEQMP